MLTADLVDARVYRGVVKPRYVDPADEAALEIAAAVIATFEANRGEKLRRLREELAPIAGTGQENRFRQALEKLLLDRCDLAANSALEPEPLRGRVFGLAAKRWKEAGPHGIDSAAVICEVAAELGVEPQAVKDSLFADLAAEQVVRGFEAPTPRQLLERYDVALAQAILLRATSLEIVLPPQDVATYRALFRAIRFHQLLFEVEGEASRGYRIKLDGPLSLFSSATRYGVQMANFLPSLLHAREFALAADVAFGPQRRSCRFLLSHEDGLLPERRQLGGHRPEEMDWFVAQFAKLEAGWRVSTEPELLDLGGRGVLVPDYVFTHERSGLVVHMEVFGYWRRGGLEARLELLRNLRIRDVILAVGRDLRADESKSSELPAELYVFRSVPIAREVAEVLRRFE
jgi:predicted nuclease of restriction endonuclease-like RecB superfamily